MASPEVERVEGPDPQVRIRGRRGRQQLVGAGALLTTLAGVWMLTRGDLGLGILGGLLVVWFGRFTWSWVRLVAPHGPAVVIDRRGVEDRTTATAVGLVPWSEIAGLGIWDSQGRRVATVLVADPEAVLARASWLTRISMRMHQRLSGTPVHIPTSSLPLTAEELVEEIAGFARTHGDTRG